MCSCPIITSLVTINSYIETSIFENDCRRILLRFQSHLLIINETSIFFNTNLD